MGDSRKDHPRVDSRSSWRRALQDASFRPVTRHGRAPRAVKGLGGAWKIRRQAGRFGQEAQSSVRRPKILRRAEPSVRRLKIRRRLGRFGEMFEDSGSRLKVLRAAERSATHSKALRAVRRFWEAPEGSASRSKALRRAERSVSRPRILRRSGRFDEALEDSVACREALRGARRFWGTPGRSLCAVRSAFLTGKLYRGAGCRRLALNKEGGRTAALDPG